MLEEKPMTTMIVSNMLIPFLSGVLQHYKKGLIQDDALVVSVVSSGGHGALYLPSLHVYVNFKTHDDPSGQRPPSEVSHVFLEFPVTFAGDREEREGPECLDLEPLGVLDVGFLGFQSLDLHVRDTQSQGREGTPEALTPQDDQGAY